MEPTATMQLLLTSAAVVDGGGGNGGCCHWSQRLSLMPAMVMFIGNNKGKHG